MGSVSAVSARAYTTTFYVMLDIVKVGRRAPPPPPAWANFSIMTECMKVYSVLQVSSLCVPCPFFLTKKLGLLAIVNSNFL
jgi:hypothetical protein